MLLDSGALRTEPSSPIRFSGAGSSWSEAAVTCSIGFAARTWAGLREALCPLGFALAACASASSDGTSQDFGEALPPSGSFR